MRLVQLSDAFLGALLLVMTAAAQTPTGTLQGTVEDSTGAVVPATRVRITNSGTNETWQLTTGATGRYVQPFLLPGTYSVHVEQEGFRPARQENVKLDVGQIRDVNFTLELGQVTEQVEVTAAAAALDAGSSAVGQVIENKRIMDLPLNGRSAFSLANLTPGVNPTGGGSTPHMAGSRNSSSEVQIDGITDIIANNNPGISDRAYEPQVDAVEEFAVQVNTLAAEYGRFGGGVMNVVTKSGTNAFHGTAYEFLRNSVLDANDFFANRAGQDKGSFKRNQWGGTLGGPIRRDRTFFFAGFEGNNQRTMSVFSGTVPTAEWRRGDFSNLRTAAGAPITIYDPLTVQADPANATRFIRRPFPGNQLPGARLDKVALNAIGFYPDPNTSPVNPYTNANNFVNSGSNAEDGYRTDFRVDQSWTQKWRTFARVSVGWADIQPQNPYGNAAVPNGGPTKSRQVSLSLDNTVTLSPTLVGNLRYGIGRNRDDRVPFSDGFDPTTLGFPSYVRNTAEYLQFPRFDMGGVASPLGMYGWIRWYTGGLVHNVSSSLTKILSSHTIKTGFEYRKMLLNYYNPGYPAGNYNFTRGWTQEEIVTANASKGFPVASFLLGLASGGSMAHDFWSAQASSYWAGYIQDDWKLSRRLTLNIGLRYDVDTPRTERYDRLSSFDMGAPSPLAGTVPAGACPSCGNLRGAMRFVDANNRTQVPTDRNNWGPRFGFAYQLTGGTVLRGGYGIAYAPSVMQAAGGSGQVGAQGFRGGTSHYSTYDTMRTIATYIDDPFPNGFRLPPGSSLGGSTDIGQAISESLFDAYRSPYIQQWSFNIQQKLPAAMVFEIGYLGNRGLGLPDGDGGKEYNQLPASYMSMGANLLRVVPNPFYGVITDSTSSLSRPTVQQNQVLRAWPQYTSMQSFRKPIASSTYHAIAMRVDKRFSKGMSFLLSYTAGKSMDDASSAVGPFLGPVAQSRLDSYNRRLEWATSSFDISQRFVASFVYEIPLGRNQALLSGMPKALNFVVSGWQANGIVTMQTGTPIFITGTPNQTGIFSGQRANNNGRTANITGGTRDQRLNKWFDTSVFSVPAAYTFGNVGRTLPDVRNPGVRSTDLSLFKNTYLARERQWNVQYRLEMFNAFNTPRFGGPGNGILASNFGVIGSSAGAPRQIQMALKLIW